MTTRTEAELKLEWKIALIYCYYNGLSNIRLADQVYIEIDLNLYLKFYKDYIFKYSLQYHRPMFN